jgi:hypothetical protein
MFQHLPVKRTGVGCELRRMSLAADGLAVLLTMTSRRSSPWWRDKSAEGHIFLPELTRPRPCSRRPMSEKMGKRRKPVLAPVDLAREPFERLVVENIDATKDKSSKAVFLHLPLHGSHDALFVAIPNPDFAPRECRRPMKESLNRRASAIGLESPREHSLPQLAIDLIAPGNGFPRLRGTVGGGLMALLFHLRWFDLFQLWANPTGIAGSCR